MNIFILLVSLFLCSALLANSFKPISRYSNSVIRSKLNSDNKNTLIQDIDNKKIDFDFLTIKDRRPYRAGEKPNSGFSLGSTNFIKEFKQILLISFNTLIIKKNNSFNADLPETLNLFLSNEVVKKAEILRELAGGRVEASPVARLLYDVGCYFLDNFFDGRPIARFWFLETVARIPYFSYVSMLHLYESLGWWRQASLRKVHNAEEWNELHHLLIMETLGGDKLWKDRFLGYHCAILYYWLLIATYLSSPRVAYQFMELLEAHAVDTYGSFLEENEDRLKEINAPNVAKAYYTGGDLYYFDEFQIDTVPGSRRPKCDTLYDVFVNIRDDESEHVRTMQACQNYATMGDKVVSPHDKFPEKENIL